METARLAANSVPKASVQLTEQHGGYQNDSECPPPTAQPSMREAAAAWPKVAAAVAAVNRQTQETLSSFGALPDPDVVSNSDTADSDPTAPSISSVFVPSESSPLGSLTDELQSLTTFHVDARDCPSAPTGHQPETWGIQGLWDRGYELGEILRTESKDGVIEVIHRRAKRTADGVTFVVKCCSSGSKDQSLHSKAQKLSDEHDMLSRLTHHAIARTEAYLTSRFDAWLIAEWFEYGDVHSHITEAGAFEEGKGRRLSRQLAEGLHYLHSNGIVHSNLKPAHIYLKTENSNLRAKIGDMSFSITPRQARNNLSLQSCSNVTGLSTHEEQVVETWKDRVDVWAYGLCVYFMLTARLPACLRMKMASCLLFVQPEADTDVHCDGLPDKVADLVQQAIQARTHHGRSAAALLRLSALSELGQTDSMDM